MTEKEFNEARYRLWLNGIIPQHSIYAIKKSLDGIFTYTSIKHGNINKGEGDVVIINLKWNTELAPYCSFEEYFMYTHLLDRIETKGIYTNIFWSPEFYALNVKYITQR